MNGTNLQVYAETAVAGTYVLVGSQRSVTINETSGVVDESNKASRDFVGTPGRYSATVDCEALYVPADAAYVLLKAAMRDGTAIRLEFTEDGGTGQTENIDAICTAISIVAPDQAECIVSASFQCTGAWSVAAP